MKVFLVVLAIFQGSLLVQSLTVEGTTSRPGFAITEGEPPLPSKSFLSGTFEFIIIFAQKVGELHLHGKVCRRRAVTETFKKNYLLEGQ